MSNVKFAMLALLDHLIKFYGQQTLGDVAGKKISFRSHFSDTRLIFATCFINMWLGNNEICQSPSWAREEE